MTRNELILKAVLHAGNTIVSIAPSNATLLHKEGRGNYVTLADKTSESIIFKHIRDYFPSDTVLSEETASSLSDKELLAAEHLWIIDPIDGTSNYQFNRKYSCVSIGYAEQGILKLGAIYDPFREELYTAEHGNGAFHNGEKMHVSPTAHIQHSTIITDNSYDPNIIRTHLETILKLPQIPWILMKGSLALEFCEVATGQADLLFSFCPKPWDNAAGFLMIEEAGGMIIDRNGKPTTFLSTEIIAGNSQLIQEFVKIIR